MLLPDLLSVDLSVSVPAVKVPVYFAVGRHDYLTPSAVSNAYFSRLVAPQKQWVWFENSADFPQWEEVEKFHELLTVRVLRDTN